MLRSECVGYFDSLFRFWLKLIKNNLLFNLQTYLVLNTLGCLIFHLKWFFLSEAS